MTNLNQTFKQIKQNQSTSRFTVTIDGQPQQCDVSTPAYMHDFTAELDFPQMNTTYNDKECIGSLSHRTPYHFVEEHLAHINAKDIKVEKKLKMRSFLLGQTYLASALQLLATQTQNQAALHPQLSKLRKIKLEIPVHLQQLIHTFGDFKISPCGSFSVDPLLVSVYISLAKEFFDISGWNSSKYTEQQLIEKNMQLSKVLDTAPLPTDEYTAELLPDLNKLAETYKSDEIFAFPLICHTSFTVPKLSDEESKIAANFKLAKAYENMCDINTSFEVTEKKFMSKLNAYLEQYHGYSEHSNSYKYYLNYLQEYTKDQSLPYQTAEADYNQIKTEEAPKVDVLKKQLEDSAMTETEIAQVKKQISEVQSLVQQAYEKRERAKAEYEARVAEFKHIFVDTQKIFDFDYDLTKFRTINQVILLSDVIKGDYLAGFLQFSDTAQQARDTYQALNNAHANYIWDQIDAFCKYSTGYSRVNKDSESLVRSIKKTIANEWQSISSEYRTYFNVLEFSTSQSGTRSQLVMANGSKTYRSIAHCFMTVSESITGFTYDIGLDTKWSVITARSDELRFIRIKQKHYQQIII